MRLNGLHPHGVDRGGARWVGCSVTRGIALAALIVMSLALPARPALADRLFGVREADGHLIVELDPSALTTLNAFTVPAEPDDFDHTGLAFDGAHLWYAASHGNLWKLHPDTGGVLAVIALPDAVSISGVAALGDRIYVLDHGSHAVYVVDPDAGEVMNVLTVDEHVYGGLAGAGSRLVALRQRFPFPNFPGVNVDDVVFLPLRPDRSPPRSRPIRSFRTGCSASGSR